MKNTLKTTVFYFLAIGYLALILVTGVSLTMMNIGTTF